MAKRGAPAGNQNAKGNRGGGRKSAYQEKQDADWLHELWEKEWDKADVTRKLKSGKISAKMVFVAKLIGGNERLLSDVFKKLVPDKMDLSATVRHKSMQNLETNVRLILDGIGEKPVAKKAPAKRKRVVRKKVAKKTTKKK